MVSEDRTSPRSGRARTSRTILTKSPLLCRIKEFYRDTYFDSVILQNVDLNGVEQAFMPAVLCNKLPGFSP